MGYHMGTYNRRTFLKAVGVGGVLSMLPLGAGCLTASEDFASKGGKSKPNIVLIMADDIGYECFGCYGSDVYQTPHLDRLASEGVRFNHCYAQPLCTPSRVKLMTGQSNIRNYVNFSLLGRDEKTFAHSFKAAGYRTCIAGKWQLYGAEHYSDEIRAKGMLPGEAGFETWCLWQVEKLGSRFWGPLLNVNGENIQFGKDQYGPDICNEFVTRFIADNKDQPFCVYYPMILVHDPFDPTPDSADRKCKDRQQNFRDMVAYMDKCVGRIVDTLKAAGVYESTLILFVGDNGTHRDISSRLGDEMIWGGKNKTTDAGTRVPLVACLPGRLSEGVECNDLIDLSDFWPTMVEATGVPIPQDIICDGVSFLPQVQGEAGNPREAIFMYYNPYPTRKPRLECRFARDQRWKLYGDGRLYDVSNDVLEKHPIPAGQGGTEAEMACKKLQRVIDSMPDKPAKIAKKVRSR